MNVESVQSRMAMIMTVTPLVMTNVAIENGHL